MLLLIPLLPFVGFLINAGNVALVGFARERGEVDGQALALFVMAVAAAEAAVGLALVVSMFRARHTLNLDEIRELRG